MKYKIIQKIISASLKFYQFIDEDNISRYSWTIWYPEYNAYFPILPHSDCSTGETILALKDDVYRINAIIELNEENPEESFNRLIKLQILK